MTYPFQHELFMSDHCNCGEQTFRIEEVTCKITVNWYPHNIPSPHEYFVRQKYCSKDQTFVTIKQKDFVCTCDETTNAFAHIMHHYKIQDTILAETGQGYKIRLDPLVIIDLIQETQQVQVRQLLRAHEALSKRDCALNELIWTDHLMFIPAKNIKRKCQIRFALHDKDIPSLYQRGGQADLFIITHQLIRRKDEDTFYVLKNPLPGPMAEGLDFSLEPERPPMNMLSLFSGGGNFDRGLEEGGCVRTKWAVEWNSHAAHTYRANCKNPEETNIFLGSVDEALARAIDGKISKLVPQVGEVDILSGGSPCQGFSQMQPNTQSDTSMTNASKVASVAAYIDHYRPSYALLENVVSMTRPLGPKKENVFSQMLCALVAMGYQVQKFNLDAWSFGDAQSRSRLFIAITAPGLVPMPHPNLTHSHPLGKANRKLGRAVNGEAFGERCFDVTPFSFVTAREATKDLPVLGDGHVLACIPFPDHRQHTRQRALIRTIMKLIPTNPPGMNLVRTAQKYPIPTPVKEYLSRQHPLRLGENSNSLCRIIGDGLFPTVVTKLAPEDGKAGRGVHWNQPRTQTLMEARRAQGFLDHEPLIGLMSTQWKIVGNSVARSVSLALGMSLREAWLGNPEHLIRRVTSAGLGSSPVRGMNSEKIASTANPVVLIAVNPSFDRSEYDSYDDCEVGSEDWTDADNGRNFHEALAKSSKTASPEEEEEEEDSIEDWTEVGDIIADVLSSLPADDGAVAEAMAQEEVAIEPTDPLENLFEVCENLDCQLRPKKVART
jgi:DNA (cytosine-5)-methyltransferase 1